MGANSSDGIVSDAQMSAFDILSEQLREVEMATVRVKQGLSEMGDEVVESGSVSASTLNALKDSLLGDKNGAGGLEVAGISKEELIAYFDAIEQGGPEAKQALEELMQVLAGKSGSIQKTMNTDLKVGKEALEGMKTGYQNMARGALTGAEATDRARKA
jgi:hypothetical protein